MSQKEKFALYLTPEMKARLERRYTEDGSRSLTGFIENAINFYLDYLSANNAGMFLPSSVQSYLDGRLDQLEKQMSSLLYKQAVELDMGMSVLADCVNLDEKYLRRKRAESVVNVKKLNGRLRLEQLAKRAQEQRNERVFAFLGGNEGARACDDEKLDKGLGSLPRISPGTSARSAGSFKGPRSQQKWGQKRQRNKILQSLSRSAYARKKKPGVNPEKGGLYEPKREIRPLSDAGHEDAAGETLCGRRQPQSHRIYRERHQLLSGLSQCQ